MSMTSWFVRLLGPIAVACVLLATGCCSGRIAECNKLIGVINKNTEVIKKATEKLNSSKKTTADINEFAKNMDQVGDEVKAVDVKDETLKGHAKEYHDMLEKLSNAAKNVGSSDPAVQMKAIADFTSVEVQESALIGKVNSYCSGK